MNETKLGCAIIMTLAVTMVLPSLGYLHAAKAQRLLQGGVNVGGVHVGAGGVSVDVGRLHIQADQCRGVSIGSNVVALIERMSLIKNTRINVVSNSTP